VILALAVRDDVIAHAREAAPDECCGILIGTPDGVSAAVRAVNLAESPSRFLIDPRDHIRARRDARAAGLDIVGFYHSHPHSAATPSPTDLAEASYVGCLYLIVGLAGDSADVKVYRFSGERFEVIDVTSG
jgi:proteasome lid subunit RPN8/RPN11